MILITLLALVLPLGTLCSIENNSDVNKSKKIQIVYIKVPLASTKFRSNNYDSSSANDDRPNYSSVNNGNHHNHGSSSSNGNHNTGNSHIGGGNSNDQGYSNSLRPNNGYENSGLNNGGLASYSSGTPQYSSNNYNNYPGPDMNGNIKKPTFSPSSSSYEARPNGFGGSSKSYDQQGKQQKPSYPFPLNFNGGYGTGPRNVQGSRPTGFQGFDKNYANQDNRANNGLGYLSGPVNQPNSNNNNNNYAFDYGNNLEKGRGYMNGAIGHSNGVMGGSVKPSIQDGFGNLNNYGNTGLIKPMSLPGKLKPNNVGDDGLGAAYGAASPDSLPYGSMEPMGDSIGPSYNPNDFFGPSATSFDTGLDDFSSFGDMSFDGDFMNSFSGLQGYNGGFGGAGELGMDKNQGKKQKGYGGLMSSALSGLGSLGFLSGGSSSNGNALTSSYSPMKGMAMAMSNTFPSFAGPKQTGNLGVTSNAGSGQGPSGNNGFGGIRTRLTNLLTGRLPSLNLASFSSGLGGFGGLSGLGGMPSLTGLGGLGGMNSGLLGLLGL